VYQGYKVVVVCPAGRRQYLEILASYILRERGLVDEFRLWKNTYIDDDAMYIDQLGRDHPYFVTVEENTVDVDRLGWGFSIFPFFKNCVDPNTIYVRVDDDMVWFEKGALLDLLKFRVDHPYYFLVFGNIINNAIISHIHQRLGALTIEKGIVNYDSADPVGWVDADFWEHCHQTFFSRLSDRTLDLYKFDRWELFYYEWMSINCIAWFGRDFSLFGGEVPREEEQWLTTVKPRELQLLTPLF
jgi:hypothetical protein